MDTSDKPAAAGHTSDTGSAKAQDVPPTSPNGETPAREVGGPKGPEPTRYGDWERNGRCSDF